MVLLHGAQGPEVAQHAAHHARHARYSLQEDDAAEPLGLSVGQRQGCGVGGWGGGKGVWGAGGEISIHCGLRAHIAQGKPR